MKILLLFITLFFAILNINYVTCNCLFRDNSSQKCLIIENIADQKWIEEVCANNKSIANTLSIVGVLKNQFKLYRTLEDFCEKGPIGRLSWINYTSIIEPLLNSKSVNMDVPHVSRVTKDNSIYLRNTNHALDEAHITEVLVENLPLRYELRNIQRTAWENVTKFETVMLEDVYLRNDDDKAKILTKTPLIVTNHSIEHVFPPTLQKGIEMRLQDEDDKIIRITVGTPRPLQEIRETMRVSKRMAPKTHTNIRINGVRAKIWFEITGDLTLVYEDFKEERKIQAQVIESKTIEIKQVPSPISKIHILYDDAMNKVEDPDAAYRTFKIFFVIACILFFGTVIVVFTDVTIKLMRMRREKAKAKSHSKIPLEDI